MFNENPKEETVIAMRNREIRLNREGEYWTDEEKEELCLKLASASQRLPMFYAARSLPFISKLKVWTYTTARQILSGGGLLQSPVDAYVRTACVIRPFVPAV